jgi:hypothetical protein
LSSQTPSKTAINLSVIYKRVNFNVLLTNY